MEPELKVEDLVRELFKVNAIKFGEFKTKVGLMTPIYCDLRVIVSYPKLMELVADHIVRFALRLKNVDLICGVPYTALPIATVVSLKSSLPMVMRRKEAKDYGTKKKIEGAFKEGSKCLLIEDVVTSGSSVVETVKDLNIAGIECRDVVVILDREQGGEEYLNENSIRMHPLFTLTEMMEYLEKGGCVDSATVLRVKEYVKGNQVDQAMLTKTVTDAPPITLEERAKLAKNPVAAKLFQIMATKETTLCVAADYTRSLNILKLAELVGPHICILKTHLDIIEDYDPDFPKKLQEIAKRHNFLLFEDRKFADIGTIVQLQYSEGLYHISSWADLITVHSILGKTILDGIKASKGLEKRGVFILAETSAAGSLIDSTYIRNTLKLVDEYPELITGVVCQSPLLENFPDIIQLTPGVQVGSEADHLGQKYNSPGYVVQRGADVAVVGRGVSMAKDPLAAAVNYKTLLWNAYLEKFGKAPPAPPINIFKD